MVGKEDSGSRVGRLRGEKAFWRERRRVPEVGGGVESGLGEPRGSLRVRNKLPQRWGWGAFVGPLEKSTLVLHLKLGTRFLRNKTFEVVQQYTQKTASYFGVFLLELLRSLFFSWVYSLSTLCILRCKNKMRTPQGSSKMSFDA